MNQITLVGRAGRDPDVRYFDNGDVVANISLAVNRRNREEKPDWFKLEIWGKQAQVAADYVRKGSLLGIIGSFKNIEKWTSKVNAEEHLDVVIRVHRLELLGSPRDKPAENASDYTQSTKQQPTGESSAELEENIPF
jgi:single-strand DNA-binding protein